MRGREVRSWAASLAVYVLRDAAAAVVVAVCFVVVDAIATGAFARGNAVADALRLTVLLGSLLAPVLVSFAAVTRAAGRLSSSVPPRLAAAALAGVLVAAPVLAVVPGGRLRALGIPMVVVAAVVAVAVGVAGWVLGRLALRVRPPYVATAAFALGLALAWLDARTLVGRHAPLHLAAGIAAALVLFVGASFVMRARPLRIASLGVGATSLAAFFVLGLSTAARDACVAPLAWLAHAPSPLGMFYANVVAPAAAPARATDFAAAPAIEEDDPWKAGEPEPEDHTAAVSALRARCPDCNIIVYFVDTLRADTASDPKVMPRVAGFSRESLHLQNAYSTASDTLRAVPSLLGGRYDDGLAPTLLDHVRRVGLDNALFTPASAHRFVSSQLPSFRFDEVTELPDHSGDGEVWGYGADLPTGTALSERLLDWAEARRGKRFFAWLYNFDLHAWRQLLDEKVPGARGLPEDRPELRYRAVASLVDRSFGALLDGLARRKLADKTIVVFVSDHGEALGYRGYDAHASYLWQPLVRVPLAIRIPKVAPRAVTRRVSLVDLAPTLARFVDPHIAPNDFHGLDLLRYHVDPYTTRTLPILLRATSDGRTSFVGLVTEERKLVIPANGGYPQLHALDDDDPDDRDLAAIEPERVMTLEQSLRRSPVHRLQ